MPTTNRIRELDGLRGVAILMVVIWHYLASSLPVSDDSILGHIKQIFSLSWSGVDLFFVLSGYLIVNILLQTKHKNSYLSTFYIRRACRILPLYLLMLVSFTFVTKLSSSNNDFLFSEELPLFSYYLFIQNFFMAQVDSWGPHWLAMTWSLAIEEQFYIIIPFLVYYLNNKKLAFIFLTAIILSPLLRFHINGLGAIVLPFCRADSILMGAMLALLLSHADNKRKIAVRYQSFIYLLVLLLVSTIAMTFMLNASGHWLNHLLLGIFYTTLVLLILTGKSFLNQLFSGNVLVWFGTRSYAIYMFHQACYGIAHNLRPDLIELKHYFIFTLIAFITTLILAELSFHFIEKPCISFGHKFKYANKTINGVKPD